MIFTVRLEVADNKIQTALSSAKACRRMPILIESALAHYLDTPQGIEMLNGFNRKKGSPEAVMTEKPEPSPVSAEASATQSIVNPEQSSTPAPMGGLSLRVKNK